MRRLICIAVGVIALAAAGCGGDDQADPAGEDLTETDVTGSTSEPDGDPTTAPDGSDGSGDRGGYGPPSGGDTPTTDGGTDAGPASTQSDRRLQELDGYPGIETVPDTDVTEGTNDPGSAPVAPYD